MSFILLGILNSQVAGAAGAGAYDLLETQTLSSSAASVTFTGLGSYTDYKHLQIRAVSRAADASTAWVNWAYFNADTSSGNYKSHILTGSGSGVDSLARSDSDKIRIQDIPGASETADVFLGLIMDVLDFSDASKNTTIRALGGRAATNNQIALSSGVYLQTSAITSITFEPARDLVAGSRFSLYGVK